MLRGVTGLGLACAVALLAPGGRYTVSVTLSQAGRNMLSVTRSFRIR